MLVAQSYLTLCKHTDYSLPVSSVRGISQAKILEWIAFSFSRESSPGKNIGVVCHSPLQGTTFYQNSSLWPIHLGWPHTAWLSFTELYKAVVHVIRLASCLWFWFQCVYPLMPSLSTYSITWVSLTLDVGYLLLATALDLGQGWLLGHTATPPTRSKYHGCQNLIPGKIQSECFWCSTFIIWKSLRWIDTHSSLNI